jgi:uncharacterized protein YbjQ (UPF0145 family)
VQLVTMDSIPGYVVRSVIGVIDTQVLRPYAANVPMLASMRQQAWEQLQAHAESIGANAVIGFRFETLLGYTTVTMSGDSNFPYAVCAYGTAVVVEAAD